MILATLSMDSDGDKKKNLKSERKEDKKKLIEPEEVEKIAKKKLE